jgi:hypothetical protein
MAACEASPTTAKKIEPIYNKKTGKLEVLKYDSDGDGKFDTISYMDGARIVRIEIDRDGDGKVDRWEYYGPGQRLEKVGFSRANDGIEDAWSFADPRGAVIRVEVATRRNGQPNRFEHYTDNALTQVEEDTDGDGRIDKWETYEGKRLASVAFDLQHRGTPDRRLIYGRDGLVRMEVDEAGNGHFVAVNEVQARLSAGSASSGRVSAH